MHLAGFGGLVAEAIDEGFQVMNMLLLVSLACSQRNSNASYKDAVSNALDQADLKGVSVAEDRDKNTVTLTGTLHSEDAKNRASQVAESAAEPATTRSTFALTLRWTTGSNARQTPPIILN